eukprot:1150742-Pelagomonas_calceolata.AAC.5
MSTHAPCGWSRKPKLHLIFNHEILVVGEEELGSGAHLAGSEMAADSVLAGAVMRAPSARAGSQINRLQSSLVVPEMLFKSTQIQMPIKI